MKILHLVHDSPFTDVVVGIFEWFKVPSRFVILEDEYVPLKMVTRLDKVEVIEENTSDYNLLLSQVRNYDIVWLHYASRLKIQFVNRLSGNIKIFWSTWGGDYCQFLGLRLYGWRNLLFLTSLRPGLRKVKFLVRCIVRFLFSKLGLDNVWLKREDRSFLQRISYYSSVLPSEESVVRKILGEKPVYLPFYLERPRSEISTKDYPKVNVASKKIWAGNSAISTNNHFDMYAELAKPRYGAYEVYSPLSYGSEGYHNQIAEYGKRMMGDRYHPILNYMPWSEYAKLMSSCSIFVFWHYRQQSVGNIMMALRMGGCVFISRRSPVYEYLKGRGLIIYSLEDLRLRLNECLAEFKPLQDANRDKAMTTYNWEEMAREMKASLEFLEKEVSFKK